MVKFATIDINIFFYVIKMSKIAYLITYISYSYVYNDRGTIEETLLKQFILDEVSEYIINNSCSTKFEVVDDVVQFWKRYGGYNVWDAYCIKNNEWVNIKPSNEDILLNIYDMTKSIETFDEECDFDEEIDLVENEFKENIKTNTDEISTNSSDLFDENIICEEDIKIDWNTISNHEQETQEQNIN